MISYPSKQEIFVEPRSGTHYAILFVKTGFKYEQKLLTFRNDLHVLLCKPQINVEQSGAKNFPKTIFGRSGMFGRCAAAATGKKPAAAAAAFPKSACASGHCLNGGGPGVIQKTPD